jgi:DNA-binding LacI/PurR family transcriptional regulator
MATIKDIAKRLNISVSTVSYALNDGPRRVPEAVKLKVLATAEELGYRPNRLARSLKQGRSHTIGVAAERNGADFYLSFFQHNALNGVLNECEEQGLDVLIFSQVDMRREEGRLNELLDGRVDGILFISPPAESEAVSELRRYGFPHVTVSGDVGAGTVNAIVDNELGVRMALKHLADLGHRDVGYLEGRHDMVDGRERNSAVLRIAGELGLNMRPAWVIPGNFTQAGGIEAGRVFLSLKDRPSAVFAANDESAVGFLHCLHDAGTAVPSDISLIGFDDSSHSRASLPPITTIQQPVGEIARGAVRGLASLIRREEAASMRFEPRLICRASTAPASVLAKS